MRLRTFGFHKMWGISRVAQDVLASHEGLCYMEIDTYVHGPMYLYLALRRTTSYRFRPLTKDLFDSRRLMRLITSKYNLCNIMKC
jgi:hypothetical protein